MSTSITTAFITDYEARVHDVFQREGSQLLPTVRHKRNVVGSSAVFQVIGKGTATTKARHGTITPMNQAHTAPSATLVDFYAGDWVDKLDEAKTNIDERQAIARGGAWALGRKVDSQITTVLTTTSQTTITWTLTSSATVRNALLSMAEALFANDVPNDGRNFGALTTKQWAHASTVQEFTRADWVGMPSILKGAPPVRRYKDWAGIRWQTHTGLPNAGAAAAEPFVWNQDAVGYASAKAAGNVAGRQAIMADITWHGDRAAHFINHLMSGGAVMIEDPGVIQGSVDDTAALPSS
jgi:hypothetical protein